MASLGFGGSGPRPSLGSGAGGGLTPAGVGLSSTIAIGGGIAGTSSGGGAASPLNIFNAQSLGAPIDGTPSAAAIAGIIATRIAGTKATLYFGPGAYGIEQNLVFPANVLVWMANGAHFVGLAPGLTLTIGGDLDAPMSQIFDTGANALAVLFSGRVRECVPFWWGALGDKVADDTLPLQAGINCARDSLIKMRGGNANYRITAGLVTQHNGAFAAIDIDWESSIVWVDFAGADAFVVQGGAALQKMRNLNMLPVVARQHANGGAYVAANVGLRLSNCKHDITALCQYFDGDGCVIESTGPNSNGSEHVIRSDFNGRGFLVTGANDNMAVIRSNLRGFGNSNEGIQVTATAALREWDAYYWYFEDNWRSDPNNPAKYAVNVGKALFSTFWIYCEQTSGTTSEIFFDPVNATYNYVFSARRNKDSLYGTNVGFHGPYEWQSGDNNRQSTPRRLIGLNSRKAQATEWVRLSLEAGDGVMGYLQGERNGAHLGSNLGNQLGVYDEYAYSLQDRIYSKVVNLVTGVPTVTINIATLAAGSAISGELRVVGAAAAAGVMTTVIDFRCDGLVLTQNAARLASAAAPNPSTAVLQVVGGVLQLVLTYVPGQWGAAYTFLYELRGLFLQTT